MGADTNSETSSSGFSPRAGEKHHERFSFSTRRNRSKRRSRSSSTSFSNADRPIDDWGKSPEQQDEAVASLRAELSQGGSPGPHEYHTLLRFLRARDYELPKASAMYVNHLQWRKDNGVDAILEDFHFTERTPYLQVYPQGYFNTDRMGRPITIQHLGKIDPRRIKEITTTERMLKYHIQEYERFLKTIAPVCSKVYGRHIDQTFAILDVKGVTLRMMTGDVRNLIASITNVMQDHYPETLGKTCIINAPFYFQAIWSLVKPLLQPRTVNKITLLGTKYMDELLKYVDAENLPEYMGGKCRNTLLDDPGPWNDPQVLSMLGMISEEQPGDGVEGQPAARKALRKRLPPPSAALSPRRGKSEIDTVGDVGAELEVTLPAMPGNVRPDALEMSSASSGAVNSPAPLLRRLQTLEQALVSSGLSESCHLSLPSEPPQSLIGRVELLESSLAQIVQIQEGKIRDAAKQAQIDVYAAGTPDPPSPKSRGCCCVM